MIDKNEIYELCVNGLLTDGGHHKQWFLEEILKKSGYDLKILRERLSAKGYSWEAGIPP